MCASTLTFLPSFSLLSSFSPSFSLSFFYSTVLCPSTFSYNISLSLFPHVVIRNFDPLPFFRLCLFLSFPMKSTEERSAEQLPLRMYTRHWQEPGLPSYRSWHARATWSSSRHTTCVVCLCIQGVPSFASSYKWPTTVIVLVEGWELIEGNSLIRDRVRPNIYLDVFSR